MNISRTPIHSSNIKSVGYGNNVLQVEFASGEVYEYENVSNGTYEELMAAKSKGSYLHNKIKGKHKFKKV
jgi:KTSC domain